MPINDIKPDRKTPVRTGRRADVLAPKKTPKGFQLSDEARLQAVAHYFVTGSARKTAQIVGLAERTVRGWTKLDWWEKETELLKAAAEDEFRADCMQIVTKATEQIMDRINNGDAVLNTKTGEVQRVPMKGKDLAWIRSITYDKLRISEGLPTSIQQKQSSDDLLSQFRKIANEVREKDVVSTQPKH